LCFSCPPPPPASSSSSCSCPCSCCNHIVFSET
jgi:hypothetical protein